jgi:hypothetical protein
MHTRAVGWLVNSYAVPREVGKVGVQSPTFIEPVQKRKDGIEAMFSRQTKTAQQQTSASRDAPPAAAAAGSGKRKRESSSPTEEKEEEKEKETGTSVSTTAPSSPAKRSKVKEEVPIKHDDAIDLEEGDSDVEILPSGPSSSQSQSVGHLHFTMHEMTPIYLFLGRLLEKEEWNTSIECCQAEGEERGRWWHHYYYHTDGFAAVAAAAANEEGESYKQNK